MKKQYQVLSPDNIPITQDGSIFGSLKKAKKALNAFAKQYATQGYYSQLCYNGYVRHIPFNAIADYSTIIDYHN